MEALQRMMSKRFSEQSCKRNAKRLVADEYANDIDSDDRTQNANLNPAYDLIYGDILLAREDDSDKPATGALCSATTSAAVSSSNSAHRVATATPNDDPKRTDKLLQKVSVVVRKRLAVPKAFVIGQHNAYRVSALDDDCNRDEVNNTWRNIQKDAEKQTRLKTTRKMMDLMDVYTVGRKNQNEHRQLLSEDYDDE